MSNDFSAPPSLLRRGIAICLPDEDERSVLQDLDGLYAQRRTSRGPMRANLWYARQTAGFLVRLGMTRVTGFVTGAEGFRADLRASVRGLTRRPTFFLAFVLTLAIGVGVISTVYAAARWVLVRPVPLVNAPDALVVMRLVMREAPPNISFGVSEPDRAVLEPRLPITSGLAGVVPIDVDISMDGTSSRRVSGEMVSANYFTVLGTPLTAGRAFVAAENREVQGAPAVIISSDLARSIAGDSSLLGASVRINGALVKIIGVAPPGFRGASLPGAAQIWMPLSTVTIIDPSAHPRTPVRRSEGVWRMLIGRPAAGVSATMLEREANAVIPAVRKEFQFHSYQALSMEFRAAQGAGLDPGVRASVTKTLSLLGGAAGLLLLLAVANLANLTLVRATGMSTATSIRFALGASRGRIARMVLTDAFVLGVSGCVMALCVATVWSRWYQATQLDEHGAALAGMHVDARAALLALAAALLASLMAFLKPAFDTRFASLESQLRRGSSGGTATRLRMMLVSAQVALTVMLLVAAGLLGRTVMNLRNINLGFEPRGILTFAMDPHLHGFEGARLDALARTLEDRLGKMPGSRAAGLISPSPLRSGYMTASLTRPGTDPQSRNPADAPISVAGYYVSPGFLDAIGARVIAGERHWRADSGTMVLTRSAAAKLFPNDDPRLAAGRVVTRRAARSEPARIAAVIEDLTLSDITREPPPSIFVPLAGRYPGLSVSAFVASTGSPERLAAAARRELAQVSAELPMYDVRTARAAVDQQFAARDAMARAAATLGLIGLLLAASGLYAVLANVIAARRREFGIRSAMGAGPRRILGSVMASGFVPVFIGMVAGLAGAAGASKALKSQMFALDNFDPWSYALALVTLIAAAALACAMPAYRASRVSPAEVLRGE